MVVLALGILICIGTILVGILTKRMLTSHEKLEQLKQELENSTKLEQPGAYLHQEAENIHTNTPEYYVDRYRLNFQKNLQGTPSPIFMRRYPLEDMYIPLQVRLYQKQGQDTSIYTDLYHTETAHDPHLWLQAERLNPKYFEQAPMHIINAIQRFRHCLIIGSSGKGKTTLLKYLALQVAAGRLPQLSDLPIYINLSSFAQHTTHHQWKLLEFAAHTWEIDYGFPYDDAIAYIQRRLMEGSAILLLDALDEAGNNETGASYRWISEALRQLTLAYPQAWIVVTMHTACYQQQPYLSSTFTELELLDFTQQDIALFVERWFHYCSENPSPEMATRLKNELRQKSSAWVLSLAAKPLSLALTCFVYAHQQELAKDCVELYAQYVELLTRRWDENQPDTQPEAQQFSSEIKKSLLAHIAWHFHRQRQSNFQEEELLIIIADFLKEKNIPLAEKNVLEAIIMTGCLVRQQSWYAFCHLTFQEYFVVLAVLEMSEGWNVLLQYIGKTWWKEAILLYANAVDDVRPLLYKLLEKHENNTMEERLFLTHLIMAGYCLAARPELESKNQPGQSIIELLFKALYNTPYATMREHIVRTLAFIGNSEINARLSNIITSQQEVNRDVQKSVLQAISTYTSNITSTIIDLMPSWLTQEELVPEVRDMLVHMLGAGDRQLVASSVLISFIHNSMANPDIQNSCASILGQRLSTQIDLPTISLLEGEDILAVRSTILDAFIASYDTHNTHESAINKKAFIDILRQLYKGTNFSIRWRSAIALAIQGEHDVLAEVFAILADENYSQDIRTQIARTLSTIRLLELKNILIQGLLPLLFKEEIDWIVRINIATILTTSSNSQVIPTLFSILADKTINDNVRVAAAYIIGNLGKRYDAAGLRGIEIDREEELHLYRSIRTSIGRLGIFSVAPTLLEWLPDENIKLSERLAILEALGMLPASDIKEYRVIPILLFLLSNITIDKVVRYSIAELLMQLAYDQETVQQIKLRLEELLETTTDIKDGIHDALWIASYRD